MVAIHGRDMSDSNRPPFIAEGPPPPELVRNIEALRQCLIDATEFSEAYVCFDDQVASDPALFSYSDAGHHRPLSGALQVCATQIQPPSELCVAIMFEVRGTGFWHGMAHGLHHQFIYFFFEDIGMGLVIIRDPRDLQGPTTFMRISAVTPPAATTPSPAARGTA